MSEKIEKSTFQLWSNFSVSFETQYACSSRQIQNRTFHFRGFCLCGDHTTQSRTVWCSRFLKKKLNYVLLFLSLAWWRHICPGSWPARDRLSCVGPHTSCELHSQTQSIDGETAYHQYMEALILKGIQPNVKMMMIILGYKIMRIETVVLFGLILCLQSGSRRRLRCGADEGWWSSDCDSIQV